MAGSLTLIVCGAPLATRAADIAAALVAYAWDTTVVGTPASEPWLDVDAVAAVTSRSVRFDYREPSTPKTGPEPEAIVVCPATFNTINKAAVGASDTYALGVLCSALGTRLPTFVVPMVNNKLWGHPAWIRSLDMLTQAGAVLLDVHTGAQGASAVVSGTGGDVVDAFKPEWITEALKTIV